MTRQGRVLEFGEGQVLVFSVLNADGSIEVVLQPARGHLAPELEGSGVTHAHLATIETPDQVVLRFSTIVALQPLLDAISAVVLDWDAQTEGGAS